MPECPICVERKRIIATCPQCAEQGCRDCMLRTICANALVPECVGGCKNLSRGDVKQIIGQQNFSRVFKPAYKAALLAREKSLIPMTMGAVEAVKRAEAAKEEMQKVAKQIEEVDSLLWQLQRQRSVLWEQRNALEAQANGANTVTEFKSIIACARSDCRGYADQSGRCLVCGAVHCIDCGKMTMSSEEAQESANTGSAPAPHECNPDEVATMKELVKSSKPCPSCGVPVTRISGCPQMWCTHCHVGFRWDTLKISKGAVSNPERDDFLRGRGWVIIREAGDVPCGGFPEINTMRRNVAAAYLRKFHEKCISSSHQLVKVIADSPYASIRKTWWMEEFGPWRRTFNPTGIREVAINATQGANTARTAMSRLQSQMTDKRVQFILDRISEDEYSDFIVKNENKIQREALMMHLHQTYASLLQDLDRDWFHLSSWIVQQSHNNGVTTPTGADSTERLVIRRKDFDNALNNYIHFVVRANQIHEVMTEALEHEGQKLGIKRLGRIREHGRITKT